MSSNSPEVFTDHNYRQAIRNEIERGMDPEVLAENGHSVYGETSTPIADRPTEDVSMPEPLPSDLPQLEDPVDNTVWHEQITRPKSHTLPTPAGRPVVELPGRNGRINSSNPPTHRQIFGGLTEREVEQRKEKSHSGFGTAQSILASKKPPRNKHDLN